MYPREIEIIKQLLKVNRSKALEDLKNFKIETLNKLKLGTLSLEFIQLMQGYLDSVPYSYNDRDELKDWLLIEQYIITTEPVAKAQLLSTIEQRSRVLRRMSASSANIDLNSMGENWDNPAEARLFQPDETLICSIYSFGDTALIELFAKYLPIPRPEVFVRMQLPIPKHIEERTKEAETVIIKLIEACTLDKYKQLENLVITKQRNFRAKRRLHEEVNRIMQVSQVMQDFKLQNGELAEAALTEKTVINTIAQANIPYRPQQCSKELADRIMEAAEKVKLFDTIKHVTKAIVLGDIFDDCIYANKTLRQLFIPFQRVALSSGDIANGDGNAICCGPQGISPQCYCDGPTVGITFILEALINENNPCVFFKQRDFGYTRGIDRGLYYEDFQTVNLGDARIAFIHKISSKENNLCLSLLWGGLFEKFATSALENHQFIANNVTKIQQILTLNFFRFIDSLKTDDEEFNPNATKAIYDKIATLTDAELRKFLKDVGMGMTDIAEFNFYGAYKINFAAIQSLFLNRGGEYELQLPEFIVELQNGNLAKLAEAIEKIPTAFQSYRFIDYLLSKVTNVEVVNQLNNLWNNNCRVPNYLVPFYNRTRTSASLASGSASMSSGSVNVGQSESPLNLLKFSGQR